MLKIGQFSRLGQVTVKTLHHYDDLGLLCPTHIDASTNYRYYTLDQLPRLHRIMALKEFDLSLEQIGLLLDGEVSTEQIRGMLRLKQAEIQQQVREEQARLAMIEIRLRMLEAEENFPILDVVVKRVPAFHVLSMPVREDHEMAAVAREIRSAIASGAIRKAGLDMDQLHYEDEVEHGFDPGHSPHEILVVVADDQPGDVELESQGVFVLRDEPAIETAATLMVHGGGMAERHEKVALLQRWAVAHGYKLGKRMRTLNYRGPLHTLDRSEWVTELQLAVESG
jgi:DNA-binding transcriptional MerR regulator